MLEQETAKYPCTVRRSHSQEDVLIATCPPHSPHPPDFVSLDYDFHLEGCMGIWAAPLWMTPDTWQWDAGSGEIDSSEFCARDAFHMNFAGGGHQVRLL